MKTEDLQTILGYVTLMVGAVLHNEGYSMSGLFFYSMALGFFGCSIYRRLRRK